MYKSLVIIGIVAGSSFCLPACAEQSLSAEPTVEETTAFCLEESKKLNIATSKAECKEYALKYAAEKSQRDDAAAIIQNALQYLSDYSEGEALTCSVAANYSSVWYSGEYDKVASRKARNVSDFWRLAHQKIVECESKDRMEILSANAFYQYMSDDSDSSGKKFQKALSKYKGCEATYSQAVQKSVEAQE